MSRNRGCGGCFGDFIALLILIFGLAWLLGNSSVHPPPVHTNESTVNKLEVDQKVDIGKR